MKRLKFLETKRTPRYSLRKFSVGVASVLLGVTIFGINLTDHSVKAATTESVATEKVQQGSASNNTTATNPTEAATPSQSAPNTQGSVNSSTANKPTETAPTSQSAPKTQGSAHTDINSLAAKSAAKLAFMNLMAASDNGTDNGTDTGTGTDRNAGDTVDQNNINDQPAKENQKLANDNNLTSSDNYSSNIYQGKDGKYYKVVTIYGNDYVYHAADIQANGTALFQKATTAEDTKNNINTRGAS